MSQDIVQMPVEKKYGRDHEYFTAEAVMNLFVLGVIFLAISLAGFIASTTYCTVRQGGTWVNTCIFETRASLGIGAAAASAGVIFIIAGCVGLTKRGVFEEK
ncbi:uncharacterized protein LOC119586956 isoform X2 [Penaeus monodon]|nr:uncharacterized protein LOC119586956 isoform X2 [Penaeus monodon]